MFAGTGGNDKGGEGGLASCWFTAKKKTNQSIQDYCVSETSVDKENYEDYIMGELLENEDT